MTAEQKVQRIKELRYALVLISRILVEEIEKDSNIDELGEALSIQKLVIEELQNLHRLH
jgi:hypothetical protein